MYTYIHTYTHTYIHKPTCIHTVPVQRAKGFPSRWPARPPTACGWTRPSPATLWPPAHYQFAPGVTSAAPSGNPSQRCHTYIYIHTFIITKTIHTYNENLHTSCIRTLYKYLTTYIHTHSSIHTYFHTYIHNIHIQTYIHTYIARQYTAAYPWLELSLCTDTLSALTNCWKGESPCAFSAPPEKKLSSLSTKARPPVMPAPKLRPVDPRFNT